MESCPTREKLIEYRSGKVSIDEGIRINEHIAGCPRCSRLVIGDPDSANARLLAAVFPETTRTSCFPDSRLQAFAQGKIGWLTKYHVRKHVSQCSICRSVVEYFRSESSEQP